MLDGSDARAAALQDFGVAAPVNGAGAVTLQVIPCLDGEARLDGELIEVTGPYALASATAVAALGLQAGNDGDTLTVNAIDYTVVAIDPDGAGLAVLSLEEQP